MNHLKDSSWLDDVDDEVEVKSKKTEGIQN